MSDHELSTLDKVIQLQNGLIAVSRGGNFSDGDIVYEEFRLFLLNSAELKSKVPAFVRRCSDMQQFWAFIKNENGTYAGRRDIIWAGFRPLIEYLELEQVNPGTSSISSHLVSFDPEHVHSTWQKALDRRSSDPEGAITAARSLLESVCKHILEQEPKGEYDKEADLPKLWGMAAEKLNLAPHQHQENIFKTILGKCQSVVNNIAAIRNRLGDAHGQGPKPVKPKSRHAELVVNLAGTMASFLVTTWKEEHAREK